MKMWRRESAMWTRGASGVWLCLMGALALHSAWGQEGKVSSTNAIRPSTLSSGGVDWTWGSATLVRDEDVSVGGGHPAVGRAGTGDVSAAGAAVVEPLAEPEDVREVLAAPVSAGESATESAGESVTNSLPSGGVSRVDSGVGGDTPVVWVQQSPVRVPAEVPVKRALDEVFAQMVLIPAYDAVPTNVLAAMETDITHFAPGKPMEWRPAVRQLIRPYKLDILEEERFVRFGTKSGIDALRREYAQRRLEQNHKTIDVNFSGGTPLHTALVSIRDAAGLSMNFDYMDPADRFVPEPVTAVSATDGGKESATPAPAPPPVKKTTYSTPENQPLEWRIVISEVLDPHGYGFIELNGTVRIMKKAEIAAYEQALVDAKPLVTRLVRVYHADPKSIVALLTAEIKDAAKASQSSRLLKHSQASIAVAQGWEQDENSQRFRGSSSSSRIQGGEGTQIGQAPEVNISFSSLNRPATPPAIMVSDVEDNLDRVEARIRELDMPGQQVLIETRILDLGRNADRELGLKIEKFGGSVDDITVAGSHLRRDVWPLQETSDLGAATTLDSARALNYSVNDRSWALVRTAVLTPFQMQAAWSALDDAGDTKVVSQPVIVVGDHSEAVIRVATLQPILNLQNAYLQNTYVAGGAGGGANNVVQSYEWQTLSVGITLWVLPEICPDGKRIRLSVHPQVTESTGQWEVAPDGSRYPTLETRELDTRILVPDGHTLLMGGLIKSAGTYSERKVPFLGDIPLIGFIFKWKGQEDQRSNLVMMMTPTILDDEQPGSGYEQPSMEASESALSRMGRNLKSADYEKLKTNVDRRGANTSQR